MDTTENLENMQCKEISKQTECNIAGEQGDIISQVTATSSCMTNKPKNIEEIGASGDSELNVAAQTKDTLLTAEQLSSKQRKFKNTNREQLNAEAQQIVEQLNSKRRQDTLLLANLRKALEAEVNRICVAVEQQLCRVYEKNSDQIQTRIQELFAYLDRISKTESELNDFKQALQILYQDMNTQ